MNYHNRKFRPESTSDNGEVDTETVFHYQQHGNVLTCSYASANIQHGQLIGLVDDAGNINMRYQQVNAAGQLRTGTCQSTPEVLPSGKIRLHEQWQWTSGDGSHGRSTLIEL